MLAQCKTEPWLGEWLLQAPATESESNRMGTRLKIVGAKLT